MKAQCLKNLFSQIILSVLNIIKKVISRRIIALPGSKSRVRDKIKVVQPRDWKKPRVIKYEMHFISPAHPECSS